MNNPESRSTFHRDVDNASAENPWSKPLNRESSCIISFIGNAAGAGKSKQIRILELQFRQALAPTVVSLNTRSLRSAANISSEDQISHILRTIVHQLLSQRRVDSTSAINIEQISELCSSRSYKVVSWNLPLLWNILHYALQDLPDAGLVVLFDDLDDWLHDSGPEGVRFFQRFLKVLGSLEHGFFVFVGSQSYEVVGELLDDSGVFDSLRPLHANPSRNENGTKEVVLPESSMARTNRTHHDPIGKRLIPPHSTGYGGGPPLYLHIHHACPPISQVEETDLRFRNLLTETFKTCRILSTPNVRAEEDSDSRAEMLQQLYQWHGGRLRSLVNVKQVKRTRLGADSAAVASNSKDGIARLNSIPAQKEQKLFIQCEESNEWHYAETESLDKTSESQGSLAGINTGQVAQFRSAPLDFSLQCQMVALSFITLGRRLFSIDDLTAALGSVFFSYGMSRMDLVENWTTLSRMITGRHHVIGSLVSFRPSSYVRLPVKIYEDFLLHFEEYYSNSSGLTAAQEHQVPFQLQSHAELLKHCLQALDRSANHFQVFPYNANTIPAETLYLENEYVPTGSDKEHDRRPAPRQKIEDEPSLFYSRILQSHFNFLGYAASHWFQHYKYATEDSGSDTSKLDELVVRYLENQKFVQAWFEHFQSSPKTAQHDPWRKSVKERLGMFSELGGSASVDGLEVASALGLNRVVKLLLKNRPEEHIPIVNALCSAARNDHRETFVTLIETGFKWLTRAPLLSHFCSDDYESCHGECKVLDVRVQREKCFGHASWKNSLRHLAARDHADVIFTLFNKLYELGLNDSTSFPKVPLKANLLRTAATAGAYKSLELLLSHWDHDLSRIQAFFRDSEQYIGQSLLQHALEGGDESCIDLVLRRIFNLEDSDAISRPIDSITAMTPLMLAAKYCRNSEPIVQKLLSHGATIQNQWLDLANQRRVLEYAARSGNVGTLKLLLQHLHGMKYSDECRPFMSESLISSTEGPRLEFDVLWSYERPMDAFHAKTPEIVRLLVGAKYIRPNLAAHMAVEFGWNDFLKELEKTFGWGEDNYPTSPDHYGRETTLLHLAVRKGDKILVQHFLDRVPSWMSVKTQHSGRYAHDGYYPVELAAICGQLSVLRIFLSYPAKSSRFAARTTKSDLLCLASEAGQYLIVAYLLAERVQINCCSNRLELSRRHSWTPIMLAAREGHLEVLKLLLEKVRSDPDAWAAEPSPFTDTSGISALRIAAQWEQHAAMVILLEDESSNFLCNSVSVKYGRTPLYHALYTKDAIRLVTTLIRHGARVDHLDFHNKTPMQYILKKGRNPASHIAMKIDLDVVRLLFDTELKHLEELTTDADRLETSSHCSRSTHDESEPACSVFWSPNSNATSPLISDQVVEYEIYQFHKNAKEAASFAAFSNRLDLLKHIYEKVPKLLLDERAPYELVHSADPGYKGAVNFYSTYSSAVKGRCEEVVRWLLSAPQSVPVGRLSPRDLSSEIHHAASLGHYNILKILLFEFNASPTIARYAKNSDEPIPPIFEAAYNARSACASTLIGAGAVAMPNPPDGLSAFDLIPNDGDIVNALLEDTTLNVNLPKSEDKMTILMRLSAVGFDKAVCALVASRKAKTNLADSLGRTALHYAVEGAIRCHGTEASAKDPESDFVETIKLLVASDANVHQEDRVGRTALDYARNWKLEPGNPVRLRIIDILENGCKG